MPKGSNDAGRLHRFAVTVDGVRHEVVVEELDADGAPATERTGAASATPADAGPAPDDNSGLAADGSVLAPMPGIVTEMSVKLGDAVNAGDVLLILTAMKLENEITAPARGVVTAIHVKEGANVNSDDRLLQLDVEEASR